MQTLTTGIPGKVILKFSLPIFIGYLLQQVYQMADNIIVGQFLGANAFAAVGATYGIFFLLSGFVWGITAGFTVLTAQKYGEGNLAETRQTIGTAMVLSAVLTIIITVLSVALMSTLLKFIQTPDDIYDLAYAYIIVICAGLAAQVLYNLTAGILRAVGNSRMPLYFLIFSTVLNIFLDLLFIIPLHLGTGGAALATVLAQGLSGILCLFYIVKKLPFLRLSKADFSFRKDFALEELSVGVPMALQYIVTSVGMLIIQTALNSLGTLAVTAYTVGNKIDVIMEQGPIAIGAAMSTYSAQNLGAGKVQRIRQGVKASICIMAVYFLVFGTLIAFWGKNLTYLFVSESSVQLVEYVDIFLKIIGSTGILLGILCIFRNCVQGMGYGTISLVGGIIELAARSIIALITMYSRQFYTICMGYPLAWLFAGIFFILIYFRIIDKTTPDKKSSRQKYLEKQDVR